MGLFSTIRSFLHTTATYDYKANHAFEKKYAEFCLNYSILEQSNWDYKNNIEVIKALLSINTELQEILTKNEEVGIGKKDYFDKVEILTTKLSASL